MINTSDTETEDRYLLSGGAGIVTVMTTVVTVIVTVAAAAESY